MKIKIHHLIILSIFSVIISSCNFELIESEDAAVIKEEPLVTKTGGVINGISEETLNSIPVDLGEIGVSVDTRMLAIYGYKPTKITVAVGGGLGVYSQQDVVVNQYTHIAVFKLKRENLTDAELKEFSNGVPITVTIFDDKGVKLENKTISRYIINATARTLKIDPTLPRIVKPLEFNPENDQYIQLATDYMSLGILNYTDGDDQNVTLTNYNNRVFKIVKTSTFATDSSYHIIKEVQPSCQCGPINVHFEADLYNKFGNNDVAELYWSNDYGKTWYLPEADKFVFEQTGRGTVKIKPLGSDTYLSSNFEKHYSGNTPTLKTYTLFFDDDYKNDLEFKIFTANISWEFTNLGIKYSPPIIPPTKMDFAFQQTILNCSRATGHYEVGVTRSEKKTISMSYEESINLFSSIYGKNEETVEVSADTELFGIGIEASASGTLTTETTTEWGKEKIANKGEVFSESQEVSYNRKVTVLPYSAIEVFDVIQKLENIKIPFVQRYIIRGAVNQNYLTGSEIESQLIANAFNGVVTERGSDFIVVSVRGAVNIENYFEFNNTMHDIVGACE